MKAKVFLLAACDPYACETLNKAFDEAWQQIAPKVSEYPRDIEASRTVVAEVVLRLSNNGCRDPRTISREVVAYWG